LPLAIASAIPAPHQHRYFLIPADKRGQMAMAAAVSGTTGAY
jgi:hypothetical protein